MPLPFILAGAAAVAGVVGIVKGAKSVSNNNEASELNEKAQRVYETAKEELEEARERTEESLESLGELKLLVWDQQIGQFVSLASQVTNVNVTGEAAVDASRKAVISKQELLEMQKISLKAQEVVGGGLQSLGAGALAGVASYGGAMMFASASTGTAIASLSGVAATNATLAWLGGGSLAAGGLGIAGGAAVLGGIVAGPVLAVGGILMEAKSRKNLAEAKTNYAKAKRAAEELYQAASMLEAIADIADQYYETIDALQYRMDTVLNQLRASLEEAEQARKGTLSYRWKKFWRFGRALPLQYKQLNREQQETLHAAYQFVQTMKILLETPLLDKKGSLNPTSAQVLDKLQLPA